MKNEVILDFCIWGVEDITPDYITQVLGIQPVKIYLKGEKTNPKLSLLEKKNGWRMGSSLNKYTPFEEQMNAMIDIIEAKKELFKMFCEKYYCEFSCAVYIRYDNGESIPSVHLNSRYNKLIGQLNIEFDLDIYCLPNKEE